MLKLQFQNHSHYTQSIRRSLCCDVSKESGADLNLAYPNAEIAVGVQRVPLIFYTDRQMKKAQEAIKEYSNLFKPLQQRERLYR